MASRTKKKDPVIIDLEKEISSLKSSAKQLQQEVIDVTYRVTGRHYCAEFGSTVYRYVIVVTKEVVEHSWFKSSTKIVKQEHTIDYSTNAPTRYNQEYLRMLNYYNAIKNHIRAKHNKTTNNWNELIGEANEVVISDNIHEKDGFILKVIDELKKLKTEDL